MQQGPSAGAEGRQVLREFTASWPGSRRYSLNDTEVAALEQAAHQAVAGAR